MTVTAERPRPAQAPAPPFPGAEYRPSGYAPPAPAEAKVTLDERRPCRVCTAPLGLRNRSGLCRSCYRDHANRPQTAKQRRDREPANMIRAALRTLESAAARAAEEDPGEGLALLVQAIPRLRDLTTETGRAVVANLGAAVTAAELTEATGQRWSWERVDERWGEKAAARVAARKARQNGGTR